MDVRKLKEGTLKRFKSGFFDDKWKDCHVALFSDSTLAVYDKKVGSIRQVNRTLNVSGRFKGRRTIFIEGYRPLHMHWPDDR